MGELPIEGYHYFIGDVEQLVVPGVFIGNYDPSAKQGERFKVDFNPSRISFRGLEESGIAEDIFNTLCSGDTQRVFIDEARVNAIVNFCGEGDYYLAKRAAEELFMMERVDVAEIKLDVMDEPEIPESFRRRIRGGA